MRIFNRRKRKSAEEKPTTFMDTSAPQKLEMGEEPASETVSDSDTLQGGAETVIVKTCAVTPSTPKATTGIIMDKSAQQTSVRNTTEGMASPSTVDIEESTNAIPGEWVEEGKVRHFVSVEKEGEEERQIIAFEAKEIVKSRFLFRNGQYGHTIGLALDNDKVAKEIKAVVRTSPDFDVNTTFHYPLSGNIAHFKSKSDGSEEFGEIFDKRGMYGHGRLFARDIGEQAKVSVEFSVFTWNMTERSLKKKDKGKKEPTEPGCTFKLR